jgi:hypothetical protein
MGRQFRPADAPVKTVRSHLSVNDLVALAATGGRPSGRAATRGPRPNPVPRSRSTRAVDKTGIVSFVGRQVLAAEILGGRPVRIRIDTKTLAFRPDHPTAATRPVEPAALESGPPAPRRPPCRATAAALDRVDHYPMAGVRPGVILVAGQKIALGRARPGDRHRPRR